MGLREDMVRAYSKGVHPDEFIESLEAPDHICQCASCMDAFDAALRQAKLLAESGHCAKWVLQIGTLIQLIGKDGIVQQIGDPDAADDLLQRYEDDLTILYLKNRGKARSEMQAAVDGRRKRG